MSEYISWFSFVVVPWSLASLPLLIAVWVWFRKSSLRGSQRLLTAFVVTALATMAVGIGNHGGMILPWPVALFMYFVTHPGSKIQFGWQLLLFTLPFVFVAVYAIPGLGRTRR